MTSKKATGQGYRSGELAAAAGVSPDTLRHYEKRGLLEPPARLSNGYRSYPRQSLARILLIQRGLSIGFTLAELRVFLDARRRGRRPCEQVLALARGRLTEVERQIDELTRFRGRLQKILKDWDVRLAAHAHGEPARLLESLVSSTLAPRGGGAPLRAMRFVHRPKQKEKR